MAKQTIDNPLLVSENKAAEYLGIGRNSLRALVANKDIKTIHLGRRVLVPMTELERWVQMQLRMEA